jgi:DNA-binding beta-propeller fold protein YncE
MRKTVVLPTRENSIRPTTLLAPVICAIAILFASTGSLEAKEKKQKASQAPPRKNLLELLDYSKIVWPNPPAITRIKYLSYFSGEKRELATAPKKSGWMDRLSGAAVGQASPTDKLFFQLVRPYGVGVDSQGKVYIADEKVLAVFILKPETGQVELIKNGQHARFKLITGLTLDDADTLFVSDSALRHVLVFDKQHKAQASISAGMASPAGLAIDNENRLLYVADSELDQILVYDADPPYKLLRTIGKPGSKHELTSPGDFSRPTNVAVDRDGNLYVTDTFNDRVEIFDADGTFVREFGKAGDGPGHFARPKGISIDSDGHVWVADAVQDRVQVFTPEGKLLIYLGGHGLLPGQFSTIAGLTIDKNNRVVTSEQYPGRVQIFQYFTDQQAQAEKDRRDAAEQAKKTGKSTANQAVTANPAAPPPN